MLILSILIDLSPFSISLPMVQLLSYVVLVVFCIDTADFNFFSFLLASYISVTEKYKLMTSECLTDGLGANMCTFTGYLPLITAVARLLFLLELLY